MKVYTDFYGASATLDTRCFTTAMRIIKTIITLPKRERGLGGEWGMLAGGGVVRHSVNKNDRIHN